MAAAVLVAVVSRPAPRAESAGVRLPAEETYAVQHDAPLFADSHAAEEPDTVASSTALGVAEPPGLGLDFVADIGIKLVAVLGLAYGSLTLLKRAGGGGPTVARAASGSSVGLRVVSSLALAPNRTVHVLQVPGGKTLLVGATPNQVNLLTELGELPALDLAPDGPSFLDVLASKLPHA